MKRDFYPIKQTLFLLIVLLFSFATKAQLVSWQFNTPATGGSEVSINSTSQAIGVENSTLVRGDGLGPGSGLARGFTSNTLYFGGETTKDSAINSNDYYQITVKAKTGYKISLKAIDAVMRRSGAGCKNYRWNYSLDGITFTEIGASDVLDFDPTAYTNGIVQPQINLSSITALQNLTSNTTITLRLYMWGATSSGGTFALGRPGSDSSSLIISGNAEPVVSPLVAWQFGVPASIGNEVSYKATTVNVNVDTPILTRGAALVPFTLGRGFSSNKDILTVTTKAEAIAVGAYHQFSITAKPGYSLSLSTINARFRRSAAGANMYRWTFSTDGVTFFDIGPSDVSFTATYDGVTQTEINLSTTDELQNVPYGTTVTLRLYAWGYSSNGGTFAFGRFVANETNNSIAISGTANLATPVKLLSFTATNSSNNSIAIKWNTATEINLNKYELQRSADGRDFETIHTVKANNGKEYSYNDKNSLAVNYYRLKMIDKDGTFKLSNIIKVDNNIKGKLSIYPNPIVNDNATVLFEEVKNEATINVYNAEGKIVLQQKISNHSTQATINTSSLIKGTYYLQLNNNGTLTSTTFIKQ